MGIESRDYLRFAHEPPQVRFHWILPLVLVALWIFILVTKEGRSYPVAEATMLFPDSLENGQIWRFFTYGLTHIQFLHILFNSLAIYMFGKSIAEWHGDAFAWKAWTAGVVTGGLVWFVLYSLLDLPGAALGASAGVSCLITGWCLHHYGEKVGLMIYFIPLNMTGKAWLILFISVDLLFMFFSEFNPRSGGGVAHSAHLGGILAGLFLFAGKLEPWKAGYIPVLRPFLWIWEKMFNRPNPRPRPGPLRPSENRLDTPYGAPSKAEIDRILDKISAQGFGSLTKEEVNTLERARRR